jgi:integrase
LRGGRAVEKPTVPVRSKPLCLRDLFDAYLDEMSSDPERTSTLRTTRIHISHLSNPKLLGGSRVPASIKLADIDDYARVRKSQVYRGKPIQRETIEKELETLGTIWRWAERRDRVGVPPPWKLRDLTQLPLAAEKPTFRDYEQIRQKIDRGGLTELEQGEAWDCLYLNGPQVKEFLDIVERRDLEPFVYPMFVFVALTGARRSELLRSEIDDFDFRARSVTIRGKKGRKRTQTVLREVDLHNRLSCVMSDWFSRHPGGQYTLSRSDGSPVTNDAANYHFDVALQGTKWAVIRGFHVFRHSMASTLASNGIDQCYIDKYLGHHTEEMKRRYQHLFPTGDKKPIEALIA